MEDNILEIQTPNEKVEIKETKPKRKKYKTIKCKCVFSYKGITVINFNGSNISFESDNYKVGDIVEVQYIGEGNTLEVKLK